MKNTLDDTHSNRMLSLWQIIISDIRNNHLAVGAIAIAFVARF